MALSWLLLVHQIPAKPAYLRVKIWRRLQSIGAVPVKNAVHALPKREGTQEDFEWLLREITQGGGDAFLCETRLIDGLSDENVQKLFDQARDADYADVAKEARALGKALRPRLKESAAKEIRSQIARLRKRIAEIAEIDFFGAIGRDAAEDLLTKLEARLDENEIVARKSKADQKTHPIATLRGKTWVTRQGVHIDRIGSAWLIRRFIDPDASFKFVSGKNYAPAEDELRFDMYQGEFTHEGDKCTFEVLVDRASIADPSLQAIGEIIHDIDLRDQKFGRDEAVGIRTLIDGIAASTADDMERIAQGKSVFDNLYEFFGRKRA